MQFKKFLSIQSRKKIVPAVARTLYRKIIRRKPYHVIRKDELGIPIVDYMDVGCQRNPVLVCNYAWKYYKEENKCYFLNCVDWLTENLSNKGAFSVWEYAFPWKTYNLTPPWVSGMAQGLGIKVFVLAYKEMWDKEFIKLACKALKAFKVPVEEGGVLQVDEGDGGYWYEEYSSPSAISSYVLNGHIFALEGIYELYALTKDDLAEKLFKEGIDELKRHIHEYDSGSWTYYDRIKHLANWKYHRIHIYQMHYLWDKTGDLLFKKYYEKWKGYAAKPFAKLLHE